MSASHTHLIDLPQPEPHRSLDVRRIPANPMNSTVCELLVAWMYGSERTGNRLRASPCLHRKYALCQGPMSDCRTVIHNFVNFYILSCSPTAFELFQDKLDEIVSALKNVLRALCLCLWTTPPKSDQLSTCIWFNIYRFPSVDLTASTHLSQPHWDSILIVLVVVGAFFAYPKFVKSDTKKKKKKKKKY